MWFLGKRETVNAWKKVDFDGFRDKEESSKWNKRRIYVGDQLDRCRWMERTQGSATRQISCRSGKDFA